MAEFVRITKEKTDPICLRASIGGDAKKGYYLVFRGDNPQDIENMLSDVLNAFKKAKNSIIQNQN